jgi:hypothetical protein
MPRSDPPAPQDYGREPQDSFVSRGCDVGLLIRTRSGDQGGRVATSAAWVMRTGSILEGITLPPYT